MPAITGDPPAQQRTNHALILFCPRVFRTRGFFIFRKRKRRKQKGRDICMATIKSLKTRVLSVFLSLVLAFGLLPVMPAMAIADDQSTITVNTSLASINADTSPYITFAGGGVSNQYA